MQSCLHNCVPLLLQFYSSRGGFTGFFLIIICHVAIKGVVIKKKVQVFIDWHIHGFRRYRVIIGVFFLQSLDAYSSSGQRRQSFQFNFRQANFANRKRGEVCETAGWRKASRICRQQSGWKVAIIVSIAILHGQIDRSIRRSLAQLLNCVCITLSHIKNIHSPYWGSVFLKSTDFWFWEYFMRAEIYYRQNWIEHHAFTRQAETCVTASNLGGLLGCWYSSLCRSRCVRTVRIMRSSIEQACKQKLLNIQLSPKGIGLQICWDCMRSILHFNIWSRLSPIKNHSTQTLKTDKNYKLQSCAYILL